MMHNLEISHMMYSKRQMRGCLHSKLFAREQNKAQPYAQLEREWKIETTLYGRDMNYKYKSIDTNHKHLK